MKVCTNTKCEKAGEPQLTKYFSRRSGNRFKKDGTPMYLSQCKRCGVIAQNERVKKKRAAERLKKVKPSRGKTKPKSTVNPYYLVRGKIG